MTQELHPLPVEDVSPPPTVGPPAPPADASADAPRWALGLGLHLPRTLTSRLVSGVVVLVLLVVAATGAATYLSLRSYLVGRLDGQVNQAANGPSNIENSRPSVGGAPQSFQKVWQLILNADGSVFRTQGTSEATPLMKLDSDQISKIIASPGSHFTMTTSDGTELRLVASPPGPLRFTYFDSSTGMRLGTETASNLIRVTGLSTAEIDRTLNRLLVLEFIIGAGAILLAFGLTAWGVRTSLGPLRRVTRTAQRVTAELSPEGAGLDRRVPETESTTEVGQLATSFNTMLDTVEAEFRARRESEERMRQFLADASHELRTPLTSIRGYAELARMQNARNGMAAAEDDSISRIETEGTRMSRLVEDLLTLARGDDADDDTPVERDWIDVGELVEDVVAGVRAAHPDRVIESRVDPGLSLWGDHNQILRVLRNLATNAAVHTAPAGAIQVEGHREGANVVLQVIDQGPGLPPEEAEHVFERFWRADKARTRVRGGSGLGMAIVAQIVQAHGGQVYFDSSVERGSTVTAVLPGRTG